MVENTSYTSHTRKLTRENINELISVIGPTITELDGGSVGYSALEISLKQIIKYSYDEFIYKPIIVETLRKLCNKK